MRMSMSNLQRMHADYLQCSKPSIQLTKSLYKHMYPFHARLLFFTEIFVNCAKVFTAIVFYGRIGEDDYPTLCPFYVILS